MSSLKSSARRARLFRVRLRKGFGLVRLGMVMVMVVMVRGILRFN